jgi:hypothetical protein
VKGKVKQGKFKIVATFKSSEDGKTIKATKNINVSDKKRVLKTKKGPKYSANSALNTCRYGSGSSGCYYNSSGTLFYYAEHWVESEHSLPFPVNKSSVHSWRLLSHGKSSYSVDDFYVYHCVDYSCDNYGSKNYFSGKSNTEYTWRTGYTKIGIADGYADWALDGDYGYSLTIYSYQIEVRYWALV